MAARARQAKPVEQLPPKPKRIVPQPPTPWPATAIELRPLDDLQPYERNARQHPPEQVAQIAASMREFGFTIPVLVDEQGTLIAGHGRVLAARRLVDEGRSEFERIPVMVAAGWSDAQRRAYTIADNRLGELASWDMGLVRIELGALRGLEFNPTITGFQDFVGLPGETDPGKLWSGMPEFTQEDENAFRSLRVHFKDQSAVDAFAALVGRTLDEKTRFIWFPPETAKRQGDKRYKRHDG